MQNRYVYIRYTRILTYIYTYFGILMELNTRKFEISFFRKLENNILPIDSKAKKTTLHI